MQTTRDVPLQLSFPGEPTTRGVGQVHDWTVLERARRAVFALAFCWVIGALFLPIPGVHFVLPPTLLLAGPIIAILRLTERTRLQTLKGACPRCKVSREFKLDLRFKGKRSFTCDGCGNLIELTPG